MANSCVNPVIYYWMNSRFRGHFNTLLCCLPRAARSALRLVQQTRSVKKPRAGTELQPRTAESGTNTDRNNFRRSSVSPTLLSMDSYLTFYKEVLL